MVEEYEVMYDWSPEENSDDLRLSVGDIIHVIEKDESGWWRGLIVGDNKPKQGYFPMNYVRKREESASNTLRNFANVDESSYCDFSISSLEAFDNLVEKGYAIELISDAVSSSEIVAAGMKVTLHCIGMTWNGSTTQANVFVDGEVSFTAGIEQVVKGLDTAILLLHVGEKANVICAPQMAYGNAGQPPFVPPNSHVVYVVTILAVERQVEPTDIDGAAEMRLSLRNNRMSASRNSVKRNSASASDRSAESGRQSTRLVLVNQSQPLTDDLIEKAKASMGVK